MRFGNCQLLSNQSHKRECSTLHWFMYKCSWGTGPAIFSSTISYLLEADFEIEILIYKLLFFFKRLLSVFNPILNGHKMFVFNVRHGKKWEYTVFHVWMLTVLDNLNQPIDLIARHTWNSAEWLERFKFESHRN